MFTVYFHRTTSASDFLGSSGNCLLQEGTPFCSLDFLLHLFDLISCSPNCFKTTGHLLGVSPEGKEALSLIVDTQPDFQFQSFLALRALLLFSTVSMWLFCLIRWQFPRVKLPFHSIHVINIYCLLCARNYSRRKGESGTQNEQTLYLGSLHFSEETDKQMNQKIRWW